MPSQFVVPQFIDAEDKILGPVTVRQFITLLVGMGLIVGDYQLVYKLFGSVGMFLVSGIGIVCLIILFAFARVNGRPFHHFLLNLLQAMKTPRMRLWNNMVEERIQYRREPPPPEPIPSKQPLTQTKLAHLAMLVDTGGAFHEEEDMLYWGQTLPKTVTVNQLTTDKE